MIEHPANRLIFGAPHVIRIIAAEDLTRMSSVKVIIRHATRRYEQELPAVMYSNIITFKWEPQFQPYLGPYEVWVYVYEKDQPVGIADWSRHDGIELVQHSCDERYTGGCCIELHGALVTSRNGISAYEVWLYQGHVGTEDDFLRWIQQPAYDAAEHFSEDHQKAVADHETAGQDHERAVADHGAAEQDHQTAGTDHGLAVQDHSNSEADHQRAGQDHGTAEQDHHTAVGDHENALQDKQRAGQDHGTAEQDHERAVGDHNVAQEDHAAALRINAGLTGFYTENGRLKLVTNAETGTVKSAGIVNGRVIVTMEV